MRAVSLDRGAEPDQIVRAALSEIKAYSCGASTLEGAVLVMHVRLCSDPEKENGTAPQRKARSR